MNLNYKLLKKCPICLQKKIEKFTLGFGDAKSFHKFLKLKFISSKWMHCNVCDHVFLNPVFRNQIKNNLYSHKSLYRNFSLGESNEEYYLNTIGDNYNKSSSIFINFKKFISRPTGRKKFFLKLLSHSSQINKKLNVLDFGAGFGAAENDLSINNVKYVGVDIDPWCLKIA